MTSRTCVESPTARACADVLIVAENGGAGGITRYCVDLAEVLRGSATILCLCSSSCEDDSQCWLARQCRARDLRLVSAFMPSKAWTRGLEALSDVWRAEERPIVHVNGRRGNFLAMLAKSTQADFNFVTTVHGMLGLHARRNALYRVVDLAAAYAASAVIAVSADTRRRLVSAGVPSSKTILIRNGIAGDPLAALLAVADHRLSMPRTSPGLRIGFLGRFSREKGIEEFTRLAQTLSLENASTTFAMAGDGPLRDQVLADSRTLLSVGRLDYYGNLSDPASFLADVDVLVMPSHNEGLPYVLLEAMAAGCAMVAYGVGGIPEAVVDGSIGCLVRPQDFERLLAGVRGFINQPPKTLHVGMRASSYVQHRFSLAERVPELLRAYERCDPEHARGIGAALPGSV